jgi:hypothetical protein
MVEFWRSGPIAPAVQSIKNRRLAMQVHSFWSRLINCLQSGRGFFNIAQPAGQRSYRPRSSVALKRFTNMHLSVENLEPRQMLKSYALALNLHPIERKRTNGVAISWWKCYNNLMCQKRTASRSAPPSGTRPHLHNCQ